MFRLNWKVKEIMLVQIWCCYFTIKGIKSHHSLISNIRQKESLYSFQEWVDIKMSWHFYLTFMTLHEKKVLTCDNASYLFEEDILAEIKATPNLVQWVGQRLKSGYTLVNKWVKIKYTVCFKYRNPQLKKVKKSFFLSWSRYYIEIST